MATTKVSTKLLETVGVAEGGTGATSTSAARTSLGLVIGTNVLAPNGSGSSLTGIATGATDAERTSIIVNAFNIATAGSFSYNNITDGIIDSYEDSTGVDLSGSTNETLSSSGYFYGLGAAALVSDSTGTIFGDLVNNGGLAGCFNGTHGPLASAGGGKDNSTAGQDYYVGKDWGSDNSKILKRVKFYGSTDSNFANLSGTMILKIWGSNTLPTGANDGTLLYESSGLSATGTATHDVTAGINAVAYRYSWITIRSTGGGNLFMGELDFYEAGTPPNMTLISNSFTANSAPSSASLVIHQQDGDAITLNTDLKAYVSRNGGTTFTQVTLTENISLTNGRILTGSASITSQSSGTAMEYKIETLNTKDQKIHAVALQWS
jgi:hypothetical protein